MPSEIKSGMHSWYALKLTTMTDVGIEGTWL